jgi:hypothetical protein
MEDGLEENIYIVLNFKWQRFSHIQVLSSTKTS